MIFYVDAFAGLGFVWLYLSGKIKAFDKRGHVSKLCIVFLPLLVASLVGISRVSDYRHHWQDVFVGGILGLCFYTSPSLSLSPLSLVSVGIWFMVAKQGFLSIPVLVWSMCCYLIYLRLQLLRYWCHYTNYYLCCHIKLCLYCAIMTF